MVLVLVLAKLKYTKIFIDKFDNYHNAIILTPIKVIYITDSIEFIMNKFEKLNDVFFPVIKNAKYFGFISKSVAIEACHNKLKSISNE